MMQRRTWPYGTKLAGVIINVTPRPPSAGIINPQRLVAPDPLRPLLVMVKTDDGEGHIIVGATHLIEPVENTRVFIQFQEGGPMKGHWQIIGPTRLWTARLRALSTADGLVTVNDAKAQVGKLYTVCLDSIRSQRMLNTAKQIEHTKEMIASWDEGKKLWTWFATELLEYEPGRD